MTSFRLPSRPVRAIATTATIAAIAASAALGALVGPALGAQAPTGTAPGAETIRYDIRFPNAANREGVVTIRFDRLPAGPLRVRMARSSPGRYATHEFAKNVYSVRATDAAGKALPVERASPQEWRVTGHAGSVVFTYTLFADRADGTYAGIDPTRAHLNIPATFAWAPGLESRPIEVTFHPASPAWKVATQLQPTSDPWTFRAPNLQYFMDSPTHLGAIDLREWNVTSGGRTQTVRLALNHLGTPEQATQFTDLTKRVVNEMAGVFGELPAFDFGTYTFIACYRPNCAGDGMEHRNSTSLTSTGSLGASMLGLLGTVSHEFFHAWNVERIRPRSLEPFDFTDANMSGELWLAEGFTNYFGALVIARAGIITPAQYAARLSNAVNTLTTSPARGFAGAVGMSQQAPFVDAATAIDPNNRANTFISYYTYGEALGIALDLMLRGRSPAVTLDDFMREMWVRHGKEQTAALAPARPYTLADAEAALAAVAKDPAFARDFFARFVVGSELPDYPRLLAQAGFLVRPSSPGRAWLGDAQVAVGSEGASLTSPSTIGSPLYEAGITAGDRIVSIGGTRIATMAEYRAALAARKPGEQVEVALVGRDGARTATLTLREDPRVEVVAFEDSGRTPTAAQLAFRGRWLASRQ